jgi:hypothetical protein
MISKTSTLALLTGVKAGEKLVLEDHFNTFNHGLWKNAVFDASNMVNGEFEAYTNDSKNSFVKDGKLYLQPTLTNGLEDKDVGSMQPNEWQPV